MFPVERANEMLNAWRTWTEDVPDEMTSVGRILQFPPIPEIPEPVRGQSFAVVQTIWLGDEDEGVRLLEPLRALGPAMDTVATIPIAELSRLHMDPEGPAPGAGDGQLLDTIDADFVDAFVDKTVGAPLISAEVRHLGGEIGRSRSHHGALGSFEGEYLMFAVGIAPTPEAKAVVEASVQEVLAAIEPWAAEHTYLNFAETRRKAATLFSSLSYHRLRRIKAVVDPTDRIRSNHPIPPARQ